MSNHLSIGPANKMTIGFLKMIHNLVVDNSLESNIFEQCKESKFFKGLVCYYNQDVAVGEILYHIEKNHIHIISVGVLPVYQKQGVGIFLFNKVIENEPKFSIFLVEMKKNHISSLNFFERLGFVQVEETVDTLKLQYKK